MINSYIKELISQFKDKNFENFVTYAYSCIQNKIDNTKKKYDKDKYIKIKYSVLEYIIANKRAITLELNKKNNK